MSADEFTMVLLILFYFLSSTAITVILAQTMFKGLREILKELRSIRFQLARPGLVRFVLKKEKFDMATSIFDVTLVLPGVSAPDVTKRVLQYSLDGGTEVIVDLGPGDVEYVVNDVLQGTTISGSLVDVDESDNQSTPSEFTLLVSDTQAPPQPGQVGLLLSEERFGD